MSLLLPRLLAYGAPRTAMAPDPPIRDDPPSCREVERVSSELKGFVGSLQSCSRQVERAEMVAYCNSTSVVHRCCPSPD